MTRKLENKNSPTGLKLVRLIPSVDDLAGSPWINREGIEFVPGQMAGYDAAMFELVEDVPVDWRGLKVALVLQDVESEEILVSSACAVDEY